MSVNAKMVMSFLVQTVLRFAVMADYSSLPAMTVIGLMETDALLIVQYKIITNAQEEHLLLPLFVSIKALTSKLYQFSLIMVIQ